MLSEYTCVSCGWTKELQKFIVKKKDGTEYKSDYCSSCRKQFGKKTNESFKSELKKMYQMIEEDKLADVLKMLLMKAHDTNDQLEEAIIDTRRLLKNLEQFQHNHSMLIEFLQIWKEDTRKEAATILFCDCGHEINITSHSDSETIYKCLKCGTVRTAAKDGYIYPVSSDSSA